MLNTGEAKAEPHLVARLNTFVQVGAFVQLPQAPRFSASKPNVPKPTGKASRNTEEVLSELGLSGDEIGKSCGCGAGSWLELPARQRRARDYIDSITRGGCEYFLSSCHVFVALPRKPVLGRPAASPVMSASVELGRGRRPPPRSCIRAVLPGWPCVGPRWTMWRAVRSIKSRNALPQIRDHKKLVAALLQRETRAAIAKVEAAVFEVDNVRRIASSKAWSTGMRAVRKHPLNRGTRLRPNPNGRSPCSPPMAPVGWRWPVPPWRKTFAELASSSDRRTRASRRNPRPPHSIPWGL